MLRESCGSRIVQVAFGLLLGANACTSASTEEEETQSNEVNAEGGESALGATACTKRNDDCTSRRACCAGSVCAFGGEREGTWCQALEPATRTRSCVQARIGAKVRTGASARGKVCLTLDSETMASTCYEVKNGYCLIGFNGECGNAEYFIHTSELVQVDPENCP